MKTFVSSVLFVCALCLFALTALGDPLDTEGCVDPPQFNRLPGYVINNCEINDFNAFDFPMAGDETTVQRAEGKFWKVDYYFHEGKAASYVGLLHNFKNAVEKAGGKVVYLDDKDMMRLTGKISKGAAETWVHVAGRDDGAGYTLVVVQKEAMKQEITSNIMLDSLNATGHIALAINFDTGKATIKDDSKPIIEQMVDLMKSNAGLKVEIQGHTDNVGKSDANQKLSEERAASVKKALVDNGIDAARMSAVGYGDTKPVADNKTDEGKAQNRRVELVKK
ncbi:MAG TPA: OmpA family protein [bacterium]|jgi:outer membrane protein OmpA-like peptidoglycan-associated protein